MIVQETNILNPQDSDAYESEQSNNYNAHENTNTDDSVSFGGDEDEFESDELPENEEESDLISAQLNQHEPWLKKVEKIAAEIAEREGCLLYDIEFASRTLRVFVDKENDNPGISDCEKVSRGLSLVLDVENIIPGEHYHLEVSTPGLERILKRDWHFSKAVGKNVRIKMKSAFENYGVQSDKWKKARTIENQLKSVAGVHLVFEVDGIEIKLPISDVERAKILFELVKAEKNNKESFNKGKKKKN